jgi:hypothetical protein
MECMGPKANNIILRGDITEGGGHTWGKWCFEQVVHHFQQAKTTYFPSQ